MTAINTRENTGTTGCIAGLFHDDSRAELAMQRLHDAGFKSPEIGMASASPQSGPKHTGFWNKVSGMFGKQEHPVDASEVEESLRMCGLPENQARYFNQSLGDGDILLTVNASSAEEGNRARAILTETGADLGTGPAAPKPATQATGNRGQRRIQLLGEVLRVHKDRVQTGEVTFRKQVVTENQQVEVPVRREELIVERAPVENAETNAQVGADEQEIRVPLSEERVRVEKKPVVKEEVVVGKKEVEDVKNVGDTVRHEELRTERQGSNTPPRGKDKDKVA